MAGSVSFGAAAMIVAVLVACVLLYRYHTLAVEWATPPAGSNIYIGGEVRREAGQKWPDPYSAGCGAPPPQNPHFPYGQITGACPVGNQPGLVHGGAMKCVNRARTLGSGCEQATKALPPNLN